MVEVTRPTCRSFRLDERRKVEHAKADAECGNLFRMLLHRGVLSDAGDLVQHIDVAFLRRKGENRSVAQSAVVHDEGKAFLDPARVGAPAGEDGSERANVCVGGVVADVEIIRHARRAMGDRRDSTDDYESHPFPGQTAEHRGKAQLPTLLAARTNSTLASSSCSRWAGVRCSADWSRLMSFPYRHAAVTAS